MTTRFAPSLTGYLHLGHVLHMIYVWGIARKVGAQVVSRMEDHDLGRARPEYEAAILSTMDGLGFIPDRGLSSATATIASEFRQSDCSERYAAFLKILEERGLVYGCACSRKQILEQQSDTQDELCYPGTCSDKNLPLEGNTVRFRVSTGPVAFRDGALGDCLQVPMGQCGDFSLRDRNGQWTYQFCAVCDDIEQGIDLVIRGEDILSSTGRQIQLFQALDKPVPDYVHHPLLCDSRGEKLSKRQRSESVTQLREAGASPEEIIGRAAFEGGLTHDLQPMNADEAMELMAGIALNW